MALIFHLSVLLAGGYLSKGKGPFSRKGLNLRKGTAAMKEVTSSVEAIEANAGKILEEGRSRANEILLKANEEANKILSSKLPIDEVKMECEQIINKAREEADKKVEEAKKKASEIRTDVEKKVEKIIGRVVGNITGAKLR